VAKKRQKWRTPSNKLKVDDMFATSCLAHTTEARVLTSNTISLKSNPFLVLQVTTRDNGRKIVEAAEERSLFIEHDLCQKARSELTNPRTRLSAEVAWMPGMAPRMIETIIRTLEENPVNVREEAGLPELAKANLMAAAIELVKDDESVDSIAEFIRNFCWVVESIDPEKVMRDINEDRAISGFPGVRSLDAIEEELAERRKFFRSILKSLLDQMDPNKLVETMTQAVEVATDGGEDHGPALLDDLVDSYEIETQGFLQKEYENISALVNSAKEIAPRGESAVSVILDKLERVACNWNRIAQPIQVSTKSRGIVHRQSRDVAYELRGLGVDLNNEHGMLQQAHRMTELLRKIFAEVPDVAERLEEDAEAIASLRRQAEQREKDNAEWARSITFRAEVGLMFKNELSISPDGIRWKGNRFPLESITRVRWGGIRRSVNGVPTGTDFTVAFGDNYAEQAIQLRKEATYNGFTQALWRAVCVRLMVEMLQALSNGRSFSFGDIAVQDSAVTLTRHKFLGNERVQLTWHDVKVWSAGGSFIVGHKDDKKVYGSASYINSVNTHLLEHIIRGGFKEGVHKLSDYLRN
jgi:hypothetical protein